MILHERSCRSRQTLKEQAGVTHEDVHACVRVCVRVCVYACVECVWREKRDESCVFMIDLVTSLCILLIVVFTTPFIAFLFIHATVCMSVRERVCVYLFVFSVRIAAGSFGLFRVFDPYSFASVSVG